MPKYEFKVPIDARNITPDTFVEKSIDELKQIKIWEGNREKTRNNRKES